MTEFALVLPVFVLIIAGLLSFGRVFFYWIEANHLANETARWAVVDKNPYAPATLQQAARARVVQGVPAGRQGLHRLPDRRGRRKPGACPRPEAFLARPDLERRDDHDQGLVRDANRAAERLERDGARELLAWEPPIGGMLVSRRLARRARGDRGQVVVIAALMIPVFLLLAALVVDAGNWYAHKRSLQNRADAGALAAGLEYTKNNNLRNCISNPGGTGTTLSNVAKAYAGTNDVSVGTTYNKNVNNQANVTVAINATDPTALDWTDGGSPCAPPLAGDGWSAAGLWTDVKVREGNIGTLFGSFGISLPQIAAQARVKVQPIIGVGTNGLPFIAETGDQIECVWAQFVRARDGSKTGFTVTPSNPILLTEGANHTWTGNVTNIVFTNAHDDVAIRYWGGSKNGSAPCDFAERPEEAASSRAGAGQPAGADRLAQRLRHRRGARRTRGRRSFDGSR